MSDVGKKKHQQLIWTHYEIKFVNKWVAGESAVFRRRDLLVARRTGEERSNSLDVNNDRHAYPPLIFSRVKSYTQAAEQPLKWRNLTTLVIAFLTICTSTLSRLARILLVFSFDSTNKHYMPACPLPNFSPSSSSRRIYWRRNCSSRVDATEPRWEDRARRPHTIDGQWRTSNQSHCTPLGHPSRRQRVILTNCVVQFERLSQWKSVWSLVIPTNAG